MLIQEKRPDTTDWPEPTYEGFGRAWLVTAKPERPEQAASIRAYIVHAPHGNTLWPWYMIAVIHLRPIEGATPPNLQFPSATHEVMIAAIDPNTYVNLHPAALESNIAFLHPIDLVHQVEGINDEQGIKLCDAIIRAILMGQSPDQDFRSYWQRSIDTTVEHYRAGLHAD